MVSVSVWLCLLWFNWELTCSTTRGPSIRGISNPEIKKYGFPNFSGSLTNNGDYPRPHWKGISNIIIETDKKSYYKLSGTVIPITVGHREKAVGPTPHKTFNNAAVGHSSGYERGHVLGLRLGGPNHYLNIVGQTAGWQGTGGEWYKMETKIFEFAMECYNWKHAPTYKQAQGIRKPMKLCNIEISVINWQRCDKGCVPKEYEIILSCGEDTRILSLLYRIFGYHGKYKRKKIVIKQPVAPEQEPLFESNTPDRDYLFDMIKAFVFFIVVLCIYWHSAKLR